MYHIHPLIAIEPHPIGSFSYSLLIIHFLRKNFFCSSPKSSLIYHNQIHHIPSHLSFCLSTYLSVHVCIIVFEWHCHKRILQSKLNEVDAISLIQYTLLCWKKDRRVSKKKSVLHSCVSTSSYLYYNREGTSVYL